MAQLISHLNLSLRIRSNTYHTLITERSLKKYCINVSNVEMKIQYFTEKAELLW